MSAALAGEQAPVGWKPTKAQFFSLIGYEIHHPETLRFHQSTKRVKIVSAPARTSKSYSAGAEGAYAAFPRFGKLNGAVVPLEGKLLWCVGPDYTTDKEFDYIFSILVDNRQKYGFDYKITRAMNKPKQGDMQIVIEWGRDPDGNMCRSIVEGKSATQEKSLQGEEIDWCVMSEAAEQVQRIYTKYLSTRCGELVLPTTPKPHADWIKQLIEKGDEDPSVSIDHFHYWIRWSEDPAKRVCANPKFNWERFRSEMRMAESLSGTGRAEDWPHFAEQFLGMWVYYSGVVLPLRWQPAVDGRMSHCLDLLPDMHTHCKTFVSVDYGYDHAAAALFWKIFPDGTLTLAAEVVETGLNPNQFIARITDKAEQLGVDPEYYVGDPSRPEVASMMNELGLPVYNHGSKNELRDRAVGTMKLIEYMADDHGLMRPDGSPGRPKLFFLRGNGDPWGVPKTIADVKVLRRREGYKGDEFAKGSLDPACDDDTYDAMRYGIMSRAQPYRSGSSRSWIVEHEQNRLYRKPEYEQQSDGLRGMSGERQQIGRNRNRMVGDVRA